MTTRFRSLPVGPFTKTDDTPTSRFRTAEGKALAISIPRAEAAVIRHFLAKMPYGLVVPEPGGCQTPKGHSGAWPSGL